MAKFSINLKKGAIEYEKKQELIVGIDLGTTHSIIAYIKDGNPETIYNQSGSDTLVPSIIHFTDNEGVIVGHDAKTKLVEAPENTIFSIKRLMGKTYDDLGGFTKILGYKIINEDEDKLVKIQVGDKFYNPIELSAMILSQLKENAEKKLKQSIKKVVITVPAYFNDSQRQATRDAGKIAGLEVLRIINEPTAASLAYELGTDRDHEKLIAVYDLGGGTFDISILRIENGIFEVLSTNGDTLLGGDDFDMVIFNKWQKDLGDLSDNKSDIQELRIKAEEAKKILSSSNEHKTNFKGRSLSISKFEFENISSSLVKRTIDHCQNAVNDAEIKISEITDIVMVGGSTRIPVIKEAVKLFFNQEVHDDLNPDEVVALGAAIQADILSGNRKDMLLLDITPLSLGIETIGGLMDVIIPRNSKVPSAAGRDYTTSVDGQANLKVSVFQGERDLVSDNRKLGEFILKGIPPMPAGIPKIQIQFMIDADGILRVKAMEKRSNVETEVLIKSQYGISEEEMALMLKDSIINAKDDIIKKGLIEAQTEAKYVILSGQKFLTQNKNIISEVETVTTQKMLNKLEALLNNGSKDEIQAFMEEFNAYTSPLAHRAMDVNISKSLKGKTV
ncbi:MAG: Fe-S protein assembly chaperone HscA [Saprospiraceae bacterium]